MMAHAAFEQDIFIKALPDTARAFLATMKNHPRIHPLIIAITPLEPTTDPDGTVVQRYRIRDRMRLGPLTVAFTYHATIRLSAPDTLKLEAFQFPRIRLFNTTRFAAEGDGTRVSEQVSIEAPRLLMGIVLQQAQQSHQQMLANLKQQLEAAAGAAPSSLP
jgi:ligand-binding SRPBCC domain-containing protein